MNENVKSCDIECEHLFTPKDIQKQYKCTNDFDHSYVVQLLSIHDPDDDDYDMTKYTLLSLLTTFLWFL